jgi:nitroimidazol reductase NimA-like FMN-containing flavoprotein (pyridoxamine 5'-phosphate oxidase superfamily)
MTMLGELNKHQIDNLLLSQAVGRIGVSDNGRPYIVPVTFVYDGKAIICQSREGMKLEILRRNPQVCFEVDSMLDMSNWQSVVVWGAFEELKGESAVKAREYLFDRVLPLMTVSKIHPAQHEVTAVIDDSNRLKPVMFRIVITERTGRFEKR